VTTWAEFAQQAPALAAFGAARFGSGVAYLATLWPDGSPRVHPVTPIVAEQLFLFMEPTSPKVVTCSATRATPCIAPSKI
jgi:hypothetical protein